MTTTVIVILLILAFFVALFYYTHRDDDETNSLTDKGPNEGTFPTPQNGTAKSMLTGAFNGVNGLRSQVSDSLTEMSLSGLPSLSSSGLNFKNLKVWPNGGAANGTAISDLEEAQANENQEVISESVPLADRVSSALNGWNPLAKQESFLPQQFKEWTERTHFAKRIKRIPESTRAMKSWLGSLETEEGEILTKQVSQFASDLNFEFSWVLDKNFNEDKELKRDLEEVIILYCLANFKGLLLQDELNTFIMFKAWLEDPTREEYNELNQKLFTTLVEQGLADGVPSDLLLADEVQRSEYAIQAINQVLQADRKGFKVILKEVLLAAEIERTEQIKQDTLDEKEKNDTIDKAEQPS